MSTRPDQPGQAAGREPLSAQDEAALRAELEEVSQRAVEAMEGGVPAGWRAGVVGLVGSFVLYVGLILALTFPFPGERTRPETAQQAVVGLGLLAVGVLMVRPASAPAVRGWREAVVLRRRLVEIRALLPAGTAGHGLYRRFIDRRYGHPLIAWLLAIPMFLVMVLPIILRRL